MKFPDLSTFLKAPGDALSKGPIALIMVEDAVEVPATIDHHLRVGFQNVILFGADDLLQGVAVPTGTHHVAHDMTDDHALTRAVNAVIAAAPGMWFYYGYNAEFLHYPFCEDRTIGEMLAFHTEERREALLTYVVDLYAKDLASAPTAVSLEDAHFDSTGYYALSRWNGEAYEERQMDFFGGLRWRFEEHVPWTRRRIDRIGLFRARPGLELRDDHTFNIPEFNTYACPWHNNLTAAICSFRTAKALKRNPGSRDAIKTFHWRGSTMFDWTSSQLMQQGLMEPGQWF